MVSRKYIFTRSGYTLVEILVVMLIMGIIIAAVSLQIMSLDQSRTSRLALLELERKISYAQQRALLTNQTLGLSISTRKYQFFYYDSKSAWQPLDSVNSRYLKSASWPKQATLTLRMDNKEITLDSELNAPQIIFNNDGVISPFSLELGKGLYLSTDAFNQLKIENHAPE